jgi:hypothetical protein
MASAESVRSFLGRGQGVGSHSHPSGDSYVEDLGPTTDQSPQRRSEGTRRDEPRRDASFVSLSVLGLEACQKGADPELKLVVSRKWS